MLQALCDQVGFEANTDARNEGTAIATILISAPGSIGRRRRRRRVLSSGRTATHRAVVEAVRGAFAFYGAGFDF